MVGSSVFIVVGDQWWKLGVPPTGECRRVTALLAKAVPTKEGRSMKRLRSVFSQSPAIVISTAALCLSLGAGASYAATSSSSSHPATTVSEAHVVLATAGTRASASGVTWTTLTLLNDWRGNAVSGGAPGYGVNGSGVVYLRGTLYLMYFGDRLFAVLPPGDRPSHNIRMPVYAAVGKTAANPTTSWLEIETNGDMYCGLQTFPHAPRMFASLAGVSFVIGE
jgi:hypothetical protein